MRQLRIIETKLQLQFKNFHQAIDLIDDKSHKSSLRKKLQDHVNALNDEPNKEEKKNTTSKIAELERSLLDDLISKHVDVLNDAKTLDIQWINRRVDDTNQMLKPASKDTIAAIDFLKQAQKIHQYTNSINKLDEHSKSLKSKDPFVKDLNKLKEAKHYDSHLLKKLMNHMQCYQNRKISKLAKDDAVPKGAISQLHKTLYDIDIKHDKKGQAYLSEMFAMIKFYKQEIKKDYAKDSIDRFSRSLVRLLSEYSKHRTQLSADILKAHRSNMGYSGMGIMGVLIFDLKNKNYEVNKPAQKPNYGHMALSNAINKHLHKDHSSCSKHVAQIESAKKRLHNAQDVTHQASILRGTVFEIRRQHQAKSNVRGPLGHLLRRSKLADRLEKEAEKLEMANENANAFKP